MKLGPLQQEWVDRLRAHPERQLEGSLGKKYHDGSYKACCLGECSMMLAEKGLVNGEWYNGFWFDGDLDGYLSNESVETIGLRDGEGDLIGVRIEGYSVLSVANDSGVTWPEIADFIEAHPEAVFTKSV